LTEGEKAMVDQSVESAVLSLLVRWGRLPYSDVVRLLPPVERLRFRESVVDELRSAGFINTYVAGDELVLALTELGRQRAGVPNGPSNGVQP
jgi:hypothetical protein